MPTMWPSTLLLLVCSAGYQPHKLHPCDQSSCYPATGNLLIGREKQLHATSTCGLREEERYCIVSHLQESKKCFRCDSRPHERNPAKSHTIQNVIYRDSPDSRVRSWWQAENGKENVSIQLDLEAEFHFTHVIITFKTFRPAAMLIERSYDFGDTWKVYRYFALNCDQSFPGVPKHSPRSLTDVVCESRYSKVAPSTDGEVIFRVLPPSLKIDDPYSIEVQNLLKMTNLRINFTKLHTLGDDFLDNRPEIQEKYYYSIFEMIVRGSCSCYGHASRCLPRGDVTPRPDTVYGRCDCTHHTKGYNCEMCEDFYNDLPWKPAIGKQSNACKACNCNNHATNCHFDEAVYEETGRISGGVCDGCEHNTMGRNCEQCTQLFYHDPQRDFTDPEACQPCDCDPRGSVDEGICDSRSDPENGLEAGKCHCKPNVDGRRCDRCKNGFWNFDENNADGCQACTCNTLGTVGNQGCDMNTGECTCKRNVHGRDCNQCLPEHFGLSEDPDGCKACECDPGGAYDNNCDILTGQCRCRPHVTGRQCNQPDQAFYTGLMDYNVYEAENAFGSDDCQVVTREPTPGGHDSFTGIGFMRTFENSDLNFTIDDIRSSMDYDIVIRYEPQLPNGWEDVLVTVERDGEIDSDGPCANTRPEDDIKHIRLTAGDRSAVVRPPACLEAGKTYHIKLSFKKYDQDGDKPTASILVDSIALVPRPESIPFFQGTPENIRHRDDFERYRCADYFRLPTRGISVPEICKQFYNSIGFFVQNGAYPCECDPTGSISTLCTTLGGQCECKPNVGGRRCDRCEVGTYGFGPEGCRACDCNSIGSLDNICSNSGQCKCRPNMYGRDCGQCQPGFWNFPTCQRCECNGYADTCDSYTGACIDCRNNTNGTYCDRCDSGYYGDPRLGRDIPCRPCPCPDTQESGHSFANQCSLDPYTQDVVCECQEGYAGPRCDVCGDNYFGNPDQPGGSCNLCNCSKNVDVSRPGNCDHRTGECLHCLFDTEGFNCEVCKAGYYGDAVNQRCIACVCNVLGTNQTIGPCDGKTGQCPCLPNVVGLSCDECKPNHWKIASGQGCEACDCDPTGSDETQCNPVRCYNSSKKLDICDCQKRCKCRPGYGGRKCDQCEANSWGNPNIECHPCQCNAEGAATMQCHQNNGSCICTKGIGGYNCDECARGYLGNVPDCRECGECFNNWDRVLDELKMQTTEVLKSASEIKLKGATGAYSRQFEQMVKKIDEVKTILDETKLSANEIDGLQSLVNQLRKNLNQSMDELAQVEDLGRNTTQRILVANLTLADLGGKLDLLSSTAKGLHDNATKLQESNVEGALNLTRLASHRSRQAQVEAERTKELSAEAERLCRRTENMVGKSSDRFQQLQDDNSKELENVSEKLAKLEDMIPELNKQVCGRSDTPSEDSCDALCGGAGCGFCGGLPCENGAARKAERALGYAQDADKQIRDKDSKAEDLFQGVSFAHQETEQAQRLVKEALEKAQIARNTSEVSLNESTSIVDRLSNFLNVDHATPNDISTRASETLKKEIRREPEQITKLAADINGAIASLTDIDKILNETRDDLNDALLLKIQATDAKNEAAGVLATAEKVIQALEEAREAQEMAEAAIDKATNDIESAGKDLAQIASETTEAQTKANETIVDVDKLQARVRDLQTRFLKNSRDVGELKAEADSVVRDGAIAKEGASKLRAKYETAASRLQDRSKLSNNSRQRAQKILNEASSLRIQTNDKLKKLQDMGDVYSANEKQLSTITGLIDELNERMNDYLRNIKGKAEYYSMCTS
ncbi:hypothetical protein FOCC_FOCC000731 [Frankliniella occidentalis]|nr:hypothetical protein FOCC_FOCC000731 [Frankliniella occidentalis]